MIPTIPFIYYLSPAIIVFCSVFLIAIFAINADSKDKPEKELNFKVVINATLILSIPIYSIVIAVIWLANK